MSKENIRKDAERYTSEWMRLKDEDVVETITEYCIRKERERCISIISEECRSHLDILKACRDRIYEVPE